MTPGPSLDRTLGLRAPSVPTCSLNVHVPWPVDERVGHLADLINAEGLGPVSKRELVAALIQTAEEAALPLWDRVLRYRRAAVGDAAFWAPEDQDPIDFEERKRGRKPL